jgi:hypothetical protein
MLFLSTGLERQAPGKRLSLAIPAEFGLPPIPKIPYSLNNVGSRTHLEKFWGLTPAAESEEALAHNNLLAS